MNISLEYYLITLRAQKAARRWALLQTGQGGRAWEKALLSGGRGLAGDLEHLGEHQGRERGCWAGKEEHVHLHSRTLAALAGVV